VSNEIREDILQAVSDGVKAIAVSFFYQENYPNKASLVSIFEVME
jgi:hypothetical protein